VTAAAGLPATGTRWAPAARSWTTTRDGKVDLFVANYLRFDLATRVRARHRRQLPVEGDPRELRAEGLPHGHEPPSSTTRETGRFRDVSESAAVAGHRR